MNTFKLAAVQLNAAQNDRCIIRDIKSYIRLAKSQGADIVCFPEAAIAESPKRNKVLLSEIMAECRDSEIWCVISTRLREKKHVYNTSVIIDENGKISGKHKKVHLLGDSALIMPGSSFDVYETRFCRIGIAICWDVSNFDAIRAMAEKGEVIVCPMYWAFDEWAHRRDHKVFEKKIVQSLILTRAYDNLVYMVFINHYDPSNPENTPYTAIAEPHRIVKDIFNREGMIIAEIDLNYLKKIRKRYSREYKKVIHPDFLQTS